MTRWQPEIVRAYANLGEQSHVAILHEALAPLMEPLRDRSLLDFGCGDGRLTAQLARHAPARIVAIDQSEDLLATARQTAASLPRELAGRMAFHQGHDETLPTSERFDRILCSLMLMMCESPQRLQRAVRGLIESLAAEGRLVLVLTHPCFRRAVHATFHNRVPEDFTYWQSGRPYEVVLRPDEQQVTTAFHDYHWTLGDYARAIALGGGMIRTMVEVPGQYDPAGQPQGDPAYLALVVERA